MLAAAALAGHKGDLINDLISARDNEVRIRVRTRAVLRIRTVLYIYIATRTHARSIKSRSDTE